MSSLSIAMGLLVVIGFAVALNSASGYFFVPIFRLKGKRWRVRVRRVEWRHPRLLTEVFDEGIVHRIWVGPLLIVAMVD